MTVTEARAALPDVLDRVTAGEEVVITRHGRPVAVMIRPDALRARRAGAALEAATAIAAQVDAGRRAPWMPVAGLTEERADDLVAEIRAGRDR
jgi:antitoxin (DNA-binding transcriptional repressor) of toxin-antitoxin stability system